MALLGVTPLAAARWSESGPQAGAGVSVVDSELRLYGPVMSGAEAEMWGLESVVTDTGAREALDGMEGDIVVALNSPGGDVWAGVAIHSALSAYSGAVNIRVDGVAASIGRADRDGGQSDRDGRAVPDDGPRRLGLHVRQRWGDAQLRGPARRDDGPVRRGALQAHEGPKSKIAKMLAEGDHWYTAEEAVKAGLADEVLKAKAKPKKDKKMAAAAAARATNLSMLLGTV